MKDWKTKTLIIGAVLGTAAGLAAAFILIRRSEELSEHPQISTREGVKIGLNVLGLLRLVSDIGIKE